MAHPQLPKGLPGIRGAMAYNRYVDGLATWQPQDPAMYASMGAPLATHGHITPSIEVVPM